MPDSLTRTVREALAADVAAHPSLHMVFLDRAAVAALLDRLDAAERVVKAAGNYVAARNADDDEFSPLNTLERLHQMTTALDAYRAETGAGE